MEWIEQPCAVYKCTIRWKDEGPEKGREVLISEKDGLPEGYEDDDIFFYGLGIDDISRAMMSKQPIEDFYIIGLHINPDSVSSRWRYLTEEDFV